MIGCEKCLKILKQEYQGSCRFLLWNPTILEISNLKPFEPNYICYKNVEDKLTGKMYIDPSK